MPITIDGTGSIGGLLAGGLPDASVTTADIANLAVTAAKIADTTITSSKLETGVGQGVCKAWVNFNGSGVIAIRSSLNVTSIGDFAVGTYTVNFNALADDNFSVGGCVTGNADPNSICMTWTTTVSGGEFVKTTSSVRVVAMRSTNNDIRDAVDCSVQIFR